MGSDLDCFFTVDTEYVWVHTLHFTQYICTCKRDCNLNMETLLFACMKQFTGMQEVYLSVYLCEALFRLREYKQVSDRTKSLSNSITAKILLRFFKPSENGEDQKDTNSLAAIEHPCNLGCIYLFKIPKLTNQHLQTIIEDEAQLADPRILISRIALTLPERLTHKDQFHIEIEPEVDRDDEGSRWKHIVATGFSPTKILVCVQLLNYFPLLYSQYFFVIVHQRLIGSVHS